MGIAKGQGAGIAAQSRQDQLRRMCPRLFGSRSHARNRLALWCRNAGGIAHHDDLWVAG